MAESAGDSHVTSIVVLGASGDLAKKKTFPSLFSLYCLGLLPPAVRIVGYARSPMSDDEFRVHASQNFKEWKERQASFLQLCYYVSGQYDSDADFARLNARLAQLEADAGANRMFYFALPPSVFVPAARSIRGTCLKHGGWTRLILEKPFGRDLASSDALAAQLSTLYTEPQMYRIDHYLGKEMVQNLMVLRFGNAVFEPLWNRQYVANVVITFKEDIGTGGRGGYFDESGIIRDVMQNHLLQMLAVLAMETPVSLAAEDARDEKVKLLRCCRPVQLSDTVIGQYGRGPNGQPSYLDDRTVPSGSVTPTFAATVVHIDNPRWKDVPFILKCGKALNERKAEIRIQFRRQPNTLFPKSNLNELVLRVQPDEAVYLKFNGKVPGLSADIIQTELDLTYKQRFEARLPDAYERLLYEALRGDQSLFVRADELRAAWQIFTPLLHELEANKVKPDIYEFGSRGPARADELMHSYGFERSDGYVWSSAKGRL